MATPYKQLLFRADAVRGTLGPELTTQPAPTIGRRGVAGQPARGSGPRRRPGWLCLCQWVRPAAADCGRLDVAAQRRAGAARRRASRPSGPGGCAASTQVRGSLTPGTR